MMASPLYPTFEKRIKDAFYGVQSKQVTPWSFMTAGPPFRVRHFDGKEIAYQHVAFEGSPEHVFWHGYIEPFLEDLCVREIGTAVSMAKERDVDGKLLLSEVQTLLSAGVKTVYASMADVDQRLRGKGYPDRIVPKSITLQVQQMERFIDELVQAELAMWRPKPRPFFRMIEELYDANKGLVWLIGAALSLLGLLQLVL